MAYQFKLDKFQGPLELLYQLVKKNKIEISEISLARVTEQYLQYLEELQEFNLDMASEFAVIAAELIEIKVKTLLPDTGKEDEEEEEEADLVKRLREYHLFKKISRILGNYQEEAARIHTRPEDIVHENTADINLELDLDLTELVDAFFKALTSKREEKTDTGKKEISEDRWKIEQEKITVEEKNEFILTRLNEHRTGLAFTELIKSCKSRLEIVVTFLSILELTRMCKIRIYQERLFANITLVEETG